MLGLGLNLPAPVCKDWDSRPLASGVSWADAVIGVPPVHVVIIGLSRVPLAIHWPLFLSLDDTCWH